MKLLEGEKSGIDAEVIKTILGKDFSKAALVSKGKPRGEE